MALLAGGGYAEEVVVDAGCALPVPDVLSLEAAGAVSEVFLTAFLNLFQLGALPADGAALVHGGGSGVGTAAIQLVKEAGGRVAVTAGSDDKCRRCLELGADVAVNYRSGDFAGAARDADRRARRGRRAGLRRRCPTWAEPRRRWRRAGAS